MSRCFPPPSLQLTLHIFFFSMFPLKPHTEEREEERERERERGKMAHENVSRQNCM